MLSYGTTYMFAVKKLVSLHWDFFNCFLKAGDKVSLKHVLKRHIIYRDMLNLSFEPLSVQDVSIVLFCLQMRLILNVKNIDISFVFDHICY